MWPPVRSPSCTLTYTHVHLGTNGKASSPCGPLLGRGTLSSSLAPSESEGSLLQYAVLAIPGRRLHTSAPQVCPDHTPSIHTCPPRQVVTLERDSPRRHAAAVLPGCDDVRPGRAPQQATAAAPSSESTHQLSLWALPASDTSRAPGARLHCASPRGACTLCLTGPFSCAPGYLVCMAAAMSRLLPSLLPGHPGFCRLSDRPHARGPGLHPYRQGGRPTARAVPACSPTSPTPAHSPLTRLRLGGLVGCHTRVAPVCGHALPSEWAPITPEGNPTPGRTHTHTHRGPDPPSVRPSAVRSLTSCGPQPRHPVTHTHTLARSPLSVRPSVVRSLTSCGLQPQHRVAHTHTGPDHPSVRPAAVCSLASCGPQPVAALQRPARSQAPLPPWQAATASDTRCCCCGLRLPEWSSSGGPMSRARVVSSAVLAARVSPLLSPRRESAAGTAYRATSWGLEG